MIYLEKLLKHKSFQYSIYLSTLGFVCIWYLSGSDSLQVISKTTTFGCLLTLPIGYIIWQCEFHRLYENPLLNYRIWKKQNAKVLYLNITIYLALIFALCITIMILLISGILFRSSISYIGFANCIYITTLYSLLSVSSSFLYFLTDNQITVRVYGMLYMLGFSTWHILQNNLIYIYQDSTFFLKLLCILWLLFIIIYFLSRKIANKNSIYDFSKIKSYIPYFIYAVIIIFQNIIYNYSDFHNAITNGLSSITVLDINSIMQYVIWYLPKLFLFIFGCSIYSKYMQTNYIYFAIRGKHGKWLFIILRKIVSKLMKCALIQILLLLFINGIFPCSIQDINLYIVSYIFIFLLISIFILIIIPTDDERYINIIAFIYLSIGILVIKFPIAFEFQNLFLQQLFNLWHAVGYIAIIISLFFIDIFLLRKKKN